MNQKFWPLTRKLIPKILVLILLEPGINRRPAIAQIIPDTTLPNNSVVIPQGNVLQIEAGTQAGRNLFHSFQDFSVPTGSEAFFNNSLTIQNIFNRVTGNNQSNIDGILKANGTANLFLLNPNGMIFGPNARLQIGGSFIGSTTQQIDFEDGSFFSATALNSEPILTINVPVGLQNTQRQNVVSEPITVQGSTLQVNSGQSLTLVGGDVSLDGSQLLADDGQIAIASLTGRGEVQLNSALGLTEISPDGTRGNLTLTNRSLISLNGNSQGISIDVGNLTVTGGSRIQSAIDETGTAGNININTTGAINISGFTADGLFSGILSRTDTAGTGGNIEIQNPLGTITLANRGFIASVTNSPNNGGNIQINTNNLALESGGQMIAATTAVGNAGDITINATESVRFSGNSNDFVPNALATIPAFDLNLLDFLTQPNANVESSGPNGIPYLSIQRTPEQIVAGTTVLGEATESFDYYKFSITQPNSQVIFDIDAAKKEGDGDVETQIFLYNLSTAQLVDTNDDSPITTGAGGSSEQHDAYLNRTVEQPGVFLLGVGELESFASSGSSISGNEVDIGDTYTLQVSLENKGTDPVSVAETTINPDNFNPNQGANSGLFSQTEGIGSGGNVTINTPQLIVSDRAEVSMNALDMGQGGNLQVDSAQAITIKDAQISSIARGTGSAGNLSFNTGQFILQNEGILDTSTLGAGNAGNVNITATDTVQFFGLSDVGRFSVIRSEAIEGSTGRAGNVAIAARGLSLQDGSRILTTAKSAGDAGSITVQTSDFVEILGADLEGSASRLRSNAFLVETNIEGAKGSAGDILIETARLAIGNGGKIESNTFGPGNAGNITLRASDSIEMFGFDSVEFDRGFVASRAFSDGNAGTITVQTDGSLTLRDGVQISASTGGPGNAGDIMVQANVIELVGTSETASSGLFASAFDQSDNNSGIGAGGDVFVNTDRLIIREGGEIAASNFHSQNLFTPGKGPAGNVQISAREIFLDDRGIITTAAAAGDRGNVTIVADDLQLRDNSTITASALGTATGGNITLNTDNLIALENSDISANAEQSFGGRISIDATGIFGTEFRAFTTPLSDITASSDLGAEFGGTVELNTPDVDPASGLVELPTNAIETANLIVDSCDASSGSSFYVTGRGGLPPTPDEWLSSDAVWVDERSHYSGSIHPADLAIAHDPIVEATGWTIRSDGSVALIARANTVTATSPWSRSPECQSH